MRRPAAPRAFSGSCWGSEPAAIQVRFLLPLLLNHFVYATSSTCFVYNWFEI